MSPSDVESRSQSNETHREIMLGLKPVGFCFKTEKCVGRASVGGWKKKGRSKEM